MNLVGISTKLPLTILNSCSRVLFNFLYPNRSPIFLNNYYRYSKYFILNVNGRKQKKKMYNVTSVVVSLRMGRRHICCHGFIDNDVTWVRAILKYGGCYETNRKGEVTNSDLG